MPSNDFPPKIVIDVLYALINMSKAVYVSNSFSHKLLLSHDLLFVVLLDEEFLLLQGQPYGLVFPPAHDAYGHKLTSQSAYYGQI